MEEPLTGDTHWPYKGPLFSIGNREHGAFYREYFVHKLQGLASPARTGPQLRRGPHGAPTGAAQVGNSETDIKTLGGLKSDAYKAYIQYSDREGI